MCQASIWWVKLFFFCDEPNVASPSQLAHVMHPLHCQESFATSIHVMTSDLLCGELNWRQNSCGESQVAVFTGHLQLASVFTTRNFTRHLAYYHDYVSWLSCSSFRYGTNVILFISYSQKYDVFDEQFHCFASDLYRMVCKGSTYVHPRFQWGQLHQIAVTVTVTLQYTIAYRYTTGNRVVGGYRNRCFRDQSTPALLFCPFHNITLHIMNRNKVTT